MKSRPILFKGEMVRAILAGTKTQTRRTCKFTAGGHLKAPGSHKRWHPADPNAVLACPHGAPGDRLWVKETFRIFDSSVECACYDECRCSREHGLPVYRASCDESDARWKPSIFMPRWASRITLELTAVRVERLNDISEADAKAEGIGLHSDGSYYGAQFFIGHHTAVSAYAELWESINGAGSWAANPWVWVIEFRAKQKGAV